MRYIYKLLFIILIVSCNQNNQQESVPAADTIVKKTDTVISVTATADSIAWSIDDTTLMSLSNKILLALKTKDYKQFATFIHPEWGIRFSPYGYVDTLHNQISTKEKLELLNKTQQKIYWGNYDGTGDSIKLNLDEYFKKFVYDADFLTAKQKSANKFISEGGNFTNLQSIYPNTGFTQFYLPGTNPKYNGMDWKALVLVFKKDNGSVWLVGVVHDQWRV